MLPNTYWQLEYIESSGSQYINTGLAPSYNLKALVKGRFTSNTGSQYAIGCYQATNINRFDVGLYNGSLQLNIGSYKDISDVDVLQTHTYILDAPNNCTYVDDTQYTGYTTETGSNARNVLLFARWQSSITYFGYFQAETYQFWENGVLVRNYIPAMRKSDNAIGLYDDVNDVFYTNAGSGTFIAGNILNAPLNITFTDNPLSLVVNSDINLIANFRLDTEWDNIIALNPDVPWGIITGNGTYIDRDNVTISYSESHDPNRLYRFISWEEGGQILSLENPYTFEITKDMNITCNVEKYARALV